MSQNLEEQLKPLSILHGDLQFICSGRSIVIEHEVLAKRSWVFQAMWDQRPALDQPLQIVIRHNLEDVVRYINYVYGIYVLDMTHCFDIPLVRSLMQFSCDIRDIDLRNTIISGLTERYPRSLRAWDNVVPVPKTMLTEKAYRCQDIDYFRFARDFAIASVLPSLLYQISYSSTLTELHEGFVRDNGSQCVLTTDDQMMCVLAKESLKHAAFVYCFAWANVNAIRHTICIQNKTCNRIRRSICREFWMPFNTVRPLDGWRQYWDTVLCGECARQGRESHGIGRRRLWKELPSHFHLPVWEELYAIQTSKLSIQTVPVYDYVVKRR